MESESTFNSLQMQIDTILIYLERPLVQFQLGTLLVIMIVGWLLAYLLLPLARRSSRLVRFVNRDWSAHFPTASLFPICALALLQITIWVYQTRAAPIPNQLLVNIRPLVLIILAYGLILTFLYARYDDRIIRPYHYRVVLPLFIWIIAVLVLSNLFNLTLLGGIPLLTLFGATITLGMVMRVIGIIYIFGTAAYLLQNTLERLMSGRTHDTATITSVLIVTRYVVLGAGILFLASALGVNTATLAFIGGGLSIGIGFGLQQIVANFISGILLLFEQSLRPGDVIDINGHIGVVEKLNIRSTSILTNDNTQIIVPNERFLTNDLYSYTRNNRLVRVAVYLGVSYNSDPKFVRDLLLKTVTQHGLTKNSPAPQVHFMEFGESSLNFRVLAWMDQPQQMPRYRSDLYFMIWEAFARNNIEIPFPQRDLHLRTGWEAFVQANGEQPDVMQTEPNPTTDEEADSQTDT